MIPTVRFQKVTIRRTPKMRVGLIEKSVVFMRLVDMLDLTHKLAYRLIGAGGPLLGAHCPTGLAAAGLLLL